jgi:hypothetical protein
MTVFAMAIGGKTSNLAFFWYGYRRKNRLRLGKALWGQFGIAIGGKNVTFIGPG